METHFATPQRADADQIFSEIEIVKEHPVMSGLLQSVAGLLAVVNEHRQVIALNDSFLRMLGITDPEKTLGLRLGEALECNYAYSGPSGCGTSKFCSSCGAAIAMVSSLETQQPAERVCALSARKDSIPLDLSLMVRSHPMTLGSNQILLLFIQDITQQQNRTALERTFFHDINNMLGMLVGSSELLFEEHPSQLSETILQASLRLSKEVAIHKSLSQSDSATYQTLWHHYPVQRIFDELKTFFVNHPASKHKRIRFPESPPDITIKTDICLMQRVLSNMVINALEATEQDGEVKIRIEKADQSLIFKVWNQGHIPESIQVRIFQRNFSTKNESGRGIGTFSMRLLGEQYLGGKVTFNTSPEDGTTFTYAAPL